MPPISYSLVVYPKFESKAKLIRGLYRPKDKFVVGEKYHLKIEVENVGQNDFPGGIIEFRLQLGNVLQTVRAWRGLPVIPAGDRVPLEEPIESEVLGTGATLLFCEMKDLDGNPAQVFDKDKKPRRPEESIGSFFAEPKTVIYQLYSLIISAISLFALVVFSAFEYGIGISIFAILLLVLVVFNLMRLVF